MPRRPPRNTPPAGPTRQPDGRAAAGLPHRLDPVPTLVPAGTRAADRRRRGRQRRWAADRRDHRRLHRPRVGRAGGRLRGREGELAAQPQRGPSRPGPGPAARRPGRRRRLRSRPGLPPAAAPRRGGVLARRRRSRRACPRPTGTRHHGGRSSGRVRGAADLCSPGRVQRLGLAAARRQRLLHRSNHAWRWGRARDPVRIRRRRRRCLGLPPHPPTGAGRPRGARWPQVRRDRA